MHQRGNFDRNVATPTLRVAKTTVKIMNIWLQNYYPEDLDK